MTMGARQSMTGAPGCFDEIQYEQGRLCLSGWILNPAGAVDRFVVRVGDLAPVHSLANIREDVGQAFPDVPHAQSTGFAVEIQAQDLDPERWISIEVIGESEDHGAVRMALIWRPAIGDQGSPCPGHLMLRTSTVVAPRAFHLDGLRTLQGFLEAAKEHGQEVRAGSSLLEWGCGPGRVLGHLADYAPDAKIAASDVDREALEWCGQMLDGLGHSVDLQVCGYRPPLPWPDDSFDLILAHSVMTHLPAALQIAWTQELGRVLKPDGVLLITTLGSSACAMLGTPEQQEALGTRGISDLAVDRALDGILPDGAYRTTFQTADWTRTHWRGLEVIETIPRGGSGLQDMVVARPAPARPKQQGRARPPILVTGVHRSGTTFVGQMLSQAPEAKYIQEPFNPHYRDLGVCSARFERLFTWIHKGNENPYLKSISRLTRLEPATLQGVCAARDWAALKSVFERAKDWRAARKAGQLALLKDPIALFSAPWLASRHDAEIVVVLRHPAGFVSSVKRLGWQTALWDLVEQTEMGEELFPLWLERAKELSTKDADIIDQAATFWAVAYTVIDDYRRQRPEWAFVCYEDLCQNPIPTFRALYHRLGLTFTTQAQDTIEHFTSSDNEAEVNVNRIYAPVDSHGNSTRWQERLTPEEQARVRAIAGPVSDLFYPPESWQAETS